VRSVRARETHDRIAPQGKIPWQRPALVPVNPCVSQSRREPATGRDNPRSASGLASQPNIVALRKVDANLQEIDAEFQALVT
jgi:hypothetical protein